MAEGKFVVLVLVTVRIEAKAAINMFSGNIREYSL